MNRLYSMALAFVEKYNAEYNCNIQIERTSDTGINLPYINSDKIYIDKTNFIVIAFYHFGNPKLFTYYRLLKELLNLNNVMEAEIIFNLLKKEYELSSKRFKFLLSQNPEWISAQLMVITIHELAHHRLKKDKELYIALTTQAKTFLKEKPFNLSSEFKPNVTPNSTISELEDLFEIIKDNSNTIYDQIAEEDIIDENFLEELSADTFVFNHLYYSTRECEINLLIANTLALLASCTFFLEFANRVNKLFSNPINEDKISRVKNNLIRSIKDSANSRIRAIYQDSHINSAFTEINIDMDSKELYNILVGIPLSNFNEILDVGFIKSLQSYQNILNEGCQIDYDESKLECISQEVQIFEDSILEFILDELNKKVNANG